METHLRCEMWNQQRFPQSCRGEGVCIDPISARQSLTLTNLRCSLWSQYDGTTAPHFKEETLLISISNQLMSEQKGCRLVLSVERADHTYSFIYSLLGSWGWGLLSLCCRSRQASTTRQKGRCLYLTSSPFKAFKMCLSNKQLYLLCRLSDIAFFSKKTKINPDMNAERRFCLLLAPCFRCFQTTKKKS